MGHVAADGGVLHVLTVLGCDVFKGAVPDGLLLAEALHLVHVDGTHSWRDTRSHGQTKWTIIY